MAYPATLDDNTTLPTTADLSDDTLATKPHSAVHGNAHVAIKALEAKVGIDASAVTTTLDYKMVRAMRAQRLITSFNAR